MESSGSLALWNPGEATGERAATVALETSEFWGASWREDESLMRVPQERPRRPLEKVYLRYDGDSWIFHISFGTQHGFDDFVFQC